MHSSYNQGISQSYFPMDSDEECAAASAIIAIVYNVCAEKLNRQQRFVWLSPG